MFWRTLQSARLLAHDENNIFKKEDVLITVGRNLKLYEASLRRLSAVWCRDDKSPCSVFGFADVRVFHRWRRGGLDPRHACLCMGERDTGREQESERESVSGRGMGGEREPLSSLLVLHRRLTISSDS